jgi:hypothetical protein
MMEQKIDLRNCHGRSCEFTYYDYNIQESVSTDGYVYVSPDKVTLSPSSKSIDIIVQNIKEDTADLTGVKRFILHDKIHPVFLHPAFNEKEKLEQEINEKIIELNRKYSCCQIITYVREWNGSERSIVPVQIKLLFLMDYTTNNYCDKHKKEIDSQVV